ncbi:MAG: DNA repair protein RecN [Rickettsiales bacterium]|nr:DNA repair protein RecN [Rickettsiales bacterium]
MLQHLSIRNIVLIETCDINFDDGLCVLTGETGAGKSILLDSLGLALGARAESGLIREGEKQASVTAQFHITPDSESSKALNDLGLEHDDFLIIRRTLSSDGKNRCFINDQPVGVNALRRIGETLVEIHGQHDQRGLLDASTHLDMLDAYGRLEQQRADVAEAYQNWRAMRQEMESLVDRIEESKREQDYLTHMRNELSSLHPQAGEEEELSDYRATMMQSEKLADTIKEAMNDLDGATSVQGALQSAQRVLSRSSLQASSRFEPVVESLERALIEVQDAITQLETVRDETEYDPIRLDEIEERLFALKGAGRKYNTPVDELPALLEDVEEKLSTLENQQYSISALESQVAQARQEFLEAAQIISDARAHAAQRLQRALMKELAPLKMERCRFRVVQEELSETQWNMRGTDAIRFEVATNSGQNYAPMHKIASGGELSRFMLALKVVLSSLKTTPTLIFDEIDTGTGGAVADAIGARLALLSDNLQVLVVTHLPQVAARGTHHLFIEKNAYRDHVNTEVRELSVTERKEELARMLAGATVTDEARGAARRLMEAVG